MAFDSFQLLVWEKITYGEQEALIMSSYLKNLLPWPVLLLLADTIHSDE